MAKNGTLFISVVNLKGFVHHILHLLVDRENLKSMDPSEWAKLLTANGVEIKDFGYFGGFDFWVDNQPRNIFQRILLKCMFKALPILKKILRKNSAIYSPYCYILAKKV